MTITLRCEHCGKEVQAPDAAGGKRGRCPYCRQSNYIPSPVTEDDVLDLAPIDEEEERRRQEEIRTLMDQERGLLAESDAAPDEPLEHRENVAPEDLHHFVINYCLDMAAGRLDRAETYAAKLRRFGQTGLEAVDEFLSGKALEPALDSIPTGVLNGFLKQLREQAGPSPAGED